jgi:hypothetical protein
MSEVEEQELEEYKRKLDRIIGDRLWGHVIRSRAKVYEEDEKSSKYFLSLEKHSGPKKT